MPEDMLDWMYEKQVGRWKYFSAGSTDKLGGSADILGGSAVGFGQRRKSWEAVLFVWGVDVVSWKREIFGGEGIMRCV